MGVTSSLQAEVKSHLSLLSRAVAPQPSYRFLLLRSYLVRKQQYREVSACGLLLVLGMGVHISLCLDDVMLLCVEVKEQPWMPFFKHHTLFLRQVFH